MADTTHSVVVFVFVLSRALLAGYRLVPAASEAVGGELGVEGATVGHALLAFAFLAPKDFRAETSEMGIHAFGFGFVFTYKHKKTDHPYSKVEEIQ